MMSSGMQTADLPVVTCAGSAGERGERHGEALRGLIADGLGRWAESIASTHGLGPDVYIPGFVQGTDFLPAIRRWTPGLLVEIEGIARGSAQPWEWIYAYNLLDEEWTWASERKAGTAPGCSVAGFAPDGGTPLLAQTMDIPNIHDGTQAVLRIEPENSPAALVFTRAGMIGLTGCNEDGLAVVVNNLDMLPASRTGLPVAFVIRGILERQTLPMRSNLLARLLTPPGSITALPRRRDWPASRVGQPALRSTRSQRRASCIRITRSIRMRRLANLSRAISGAGLDGGWTISSARQGRGPTSLDCKNCSPTAPFP